MKRIIGIDPDSKKHGVAVYVDGNLSELAMMSTVELLTSPPVLRLGQRDVDLVSIEDVWHNNFVYTRNATTKDLKVITDIGRKVGRCQQAQLELMRWLDYYGIPYVLHKPQRGNWAKRR